MSKRVLESLKERASNYGQITLNKGHERVQIFNDLDSISRLRFKSLLYKWKHCSGNHSDFYNPMKDEFSFEELSKLFTWLKLMRRREGEYDTLEKTAINFDELSNEIKERLNHFETMDEEEINMRREENEIYRIHLLFLSEVGHSANTERSHYETFISAISAMHSAEEGEMDESVFFKGPVEDISDSQYDRNYVEGKNLRMQEKNRSIKKSRKTRDDTVDDADVNTDV